VEQESRSTQATKFLLLLVRPIARIWERVLEAK